MFYKRNKKGFSLIELIAVVAILAIVATTVALAVSKAIASNKEKSYKAEMESYYVTTHSLVQLINSGRGKSKLSVYKDWVTRNSASGTYTNTSIESEFKSRISPDNYSFVRTFFQKTIPLTSFVDGLYMKLIIKDEKYIAISDFYMVRAGVVFKMVPGEDGYWIADKIA